VVGDVRPGAPLGFTPREAEPADDGADGLVPLDPGPDEAGTEGLEVNPDPGREEGTADGFDKEVDDPELSPPEVAAPEPSPPEEVGAVPIPLEVVDPTPEEPAAEPVLPTEPAEPPEAPPPELDPPPEPPPEDWASAVPESVRARITKAATRIGSSFSG